MKSVNKDYFVSDGKIEHCEEKWLVQWKKIIFTCEAKNAVSLNVNCRPWLCPVPCLHHINKAAKRWNSSPGSKLPGITEFRLRPSASASHFAAYNRICIHPRCSQRECIQISKRSMRLLKGVNRVYAIFPLNSLFWRLWHSASRWSLLILLQIVLYIFIILVNHWFTHRHFNITSPIIESK